MNELVQAAGRDAAIHVLKGNITLFRNYKYFIQRYHFEHDTCLASFWRVDFSTSAGFNDLKRNLHDFMREKQEEGVGVITAEHITSFFDKIKRSRVEESSGDDF